LSKINVLPREIFELIAAGEVVERPSSVVKELIENSVDAGATKITVEIMRGGISFIRITDDGSGIDRADVKSAFVSHATSKIKKIEDLDSILTFGFRGEALASIAAVAKVEMLTKTADEEIGTRYRIEGGEEKILDDAGCPDGTTIIVSDLFYNTPARMKFLKRDNTEGNYVADAVARAALSHPEVSYRLIKDGKQTLFTSGDGDLKNTIYAVYGKDFANGLIPCNYELNGISVKGYISKPLNCRPNRNMQHFYVNTRYVKIPVASVALDEAYRHSTMVGRFPSCVLLLNIAPETVDVNVHPAKTEVRFSDEKRIFDVIYYGAKSTILANDTRAEYTFDKSKPLYTAPVSQAAGHIITDESKPQQMIFDTPKPSVYSPVSAPKVDFSSYNDKEEESNFVIPEKEDEKTTVSENEIANIVTDNFVADENETVETEPVLVVEQEKKQEPIKIICEAFKTYIICEYGSKLLLIDKHALHERILFNDLKNNRREDYSQVLLFPLSVTLSMKEYDALLENLDFLSSAGFCVEDFGSGTVLVREAPLSLDGEDVEDIIIELAGYLLKNIKEPEPEKLDWLYHNTACRAAIKAGKSLNDMEMRALVERFLSDDSLRYCPHGRPVVIEMTQREIEKQFGRQGSI